MSQDVRRVDGFALVRIVDQHFPSRTRHAHVARIPCVGELVDGGGETLLRVVHVIHTAHPGAPSADEPDAVVYVEATTRGRS